MKAPLRVPTSTRTLLIGLFSLVLAASASPGAAPGPSPRSCASRSTRYISHLPVYVAIERGYFAAAGIDLQIMTKWSGLPPEVITRLGRVPYFEEYGAISLESLRRTSLIAAAQHAAGVH